MNKLLNIEIVKFLCLHGAIIDAKDDNNFTPLYECVLYKLNGDDLDVIYHLVECGADINYIPKNS